MEEQATFSGDCLEDRVARVLPLVVPEQQRVPSSPAFDRVDTGRRARRRTVVRHLVSLGRGDGRHMRAPDGDNVARHHRQRRLHGQRKRDRVRARGRAPWHLGTDRSRRRPGSAVRSDATGVRPPLRLRAGQSWAARVTTSHSRPPNLSRSPRPVETTACAAIPRTTG